MESNITDVKPVDFETKSGSERKSLPLSRAKLEKRSLSPLIVRNRLEFSSGVLHITKLHTSDRAYGITHI
jgi:hypothetical protein